MDASYKIQRGIHVHLIQFFMCPEFWVHISRVKSAFVFIGSSTKTVNLHVLAIELDSTICSTFSQRINGLVRNSDCAHQIPSRCTLCLRIQVELAAIVRIDLQLILGISILNLA